MKYPVTPPEDQTRIHFSRAILLQTAAALDDDDAGRPLTMPPAAI